MADYVTVHRAGINIQQVVDTETPTPILATLNPVAVGPCYQIVEAVNSDGSLNTHAAVGTYTNLQHQIKKTAFPDPRSNLEDLVFVDDDTRVFVQIGQDVRELKEDERYLCGNYEADGTIRAIGTGTYSSQIDITGGTPAPSFTTNEDSAVLTGKADLSAGANVNGKKLVFRVDGYWDQVQVEFSGADPISANSIRDQINAKWHDMGFSGDIASIDGSDHLVLTSPSKGLESILKIDTAASTCLTELGFNSAAPQNLYDYGTPYKPQPGDELWVDGKLLGTILSVDAANRVTLDQQYVVHPKPGALDGKRWWIRAKNLPTPKASNRPTPELFKYTADTQPSITGEQDLSGTTTFTNEPFKFSIDNKSETSVLLNGSLTLTEIVNQINMAYGQTVASASGNYLKLTSPTTGNRAAVEIGSGTANTKLGFTAGDREEGISKGDLLLAAEFLRYATTGTPLDPGKGVIYIQYKALRKDVTALSSNGLISVSTQTELEEAIGPLTQDNPLGLAGLTMLRAAPGLTISLLGVDSVTSNAEGDREAYQRAFDFLKTREVYAIAVLTHQKEVIDDLKTHVSNASGLYGRRERVGYFCFDLPERKAPTTVDSGTDANSISTGVIETESDLSAALLAAGVPDPSNMPLSGEYHAYMMFEGDTKRYNIGSVSGMRAIGNTTFAVGENTDGFYSTTPIPDNYISKTWTLYLRGKKISTVSGTPNYDEIAVAYQKLALSIGDRRMRSVIPHEVVCDDGNGMSVRVEGYYLAAASAARRCFVAPQQGLTNYNIEGFTQLYGSNDLFNEEQLEIIGYNNYVFVQEPVGAGNPITTWHQATTDGTNDDTREETITTCLDFGAKVLRRGLRNFLGKVNITENFETLLNQAVDSLISFIVGTGAWIGAKVISYQREPDRKTAIRLRLKIDLPYPCNDIYLDLVV